MKGATKTNHSVPHSTDMQMEQRNSRLEIRASSSGRTWSDSAIEDNSLWSFERATSVNANFSKCSCFDNPEEQSTYHE